MTNFDEELTIWIGGYEAEGEGEAPAEGDATGEDAGDESAEGEGEAPAEGDDTGEDAGDEGGSDEAGAPDAYADFNLPEGYEITEEISGQMTELFKETGLSQEAAQKFVDLHTQIVESGTEGNAEAYVNLVESWKTDAAKDPEIGGEKFEENIATAQKAIDAFGTPELGKMLTEYGFGNHPEFVRFAYNIGKLVSEDSPGQLGNQPAGDKSTVRTLYPDDPVRSS